VTDMIKDKAKNRSLNLLMQGVSRSVRIFRLIVLNEYYMVTPL